MVGEQKGKKETKDEPNLDAPLHDLVWYPLRARSSSSVRSKAEVRDEPATNKREVTDQHIDVQEREIEGGPPCRGT